MQDNDNEDQFIIITYIYIGGGGPSKSYITQTGWGCQFFQKKALRRCKVQRYYYLALRGGGTGWGSNFQGKSIT